MTHKRTRLMMMAMAGAGLLAAGVATQKASTATVTAVASGNWNSDIWDGSDSSTDVDPGLRPGPGVSVLTTSGANIAILLNSDVGTINIFENRSNGGSLTIEDGGALGWTGSNFEVVRSTTASVTMTGGTLTGDNSSTLYLARVQTSADVSGTFTQSGGTVTTNTLRLTDVISNTGTPSGTYNLSGSGVLNVTGDLDPGSNPANAAFNFTGGTLVHHGLLMNLTNDGGTLALGGVDAVGTSLLNGAADTVGHNYTQNSGTLAIDIADATHYDQLLGTDATSGSNNVTLNGTLLINLLAGAGLAGGETFDLITTADIADSSIIDHTTLQILGLTSGTFTKSIVAGTGDSDILRLTYVATIPEPASLALLALGGLTLLPRRRRA